MSFCDSAGLRALLTISRDRPRGRVVLREPRPHLRRLLELTALDASFDIED
jgi:anti-anti-sigma regulatory factor